MMNTRIVKPVAFTREAREQATLDSIPVPEQIRHMRDIYTRKQEKLILGVRHGDKASKKKRSKRRSRSPGKRRTGTVASARNPPRAGGSRAGTRPSAENQGHSGMNFASSIDASVSMLSIGTIIDEFNSILGSAKASHDASISKGESGPATNLFGDSSTVQTSSVPVLARPRRPLTPAAFGKLKLFCRYPDCKKEFHDAFSLFEHTKSSHSHQQSSPFKQSVVGMENNGRGRPLTTGSMKDSRPRSPPRRENCSGLLPEVPRNRKPSPDRTGVVWPVDVLQQQNKWKEGQDLEVFAQHTEQLRRFNILLTQDMKDKDWSLNKSTRNLKVVETQLLNKEI